MSLKKCHTPTLQLVCVLTTIYVAKDIKFAEALPVVRKLSRLLISLAESSGKFVRRGWDLVMGKYPRESINFSFFIVLCQESLEMSVFPIYFLPFAFTLRPLKKKLTISCSCMHHALPEGTNNWKSSTQVLSSNHYFFQSHTSSNLFRE